MPHEGSLRLPVTLRQSQSWSGPSEPRPRAHARRRRLRLLPLRASPAQQATASLKNTSRHAVRCGVCDDGPSAPNDSQLDHWKSSPGLHLSHNRLHDRRDWEARSFTARLYISRRFIPGHCCVHHLQLLSRGNASNWHTGERLPRALKAGDVGGTIRPGDEGAEPPCTTGMAPTPPPPPCGRKERRCASSASCSLMRQFAADSASWKARPSAVRFCALTRYVGCRPIRLFRKGFVKTDLLAALRC